MLLNNAYKFQFLSFVFLLILKNHLSTGLLSISCSLLDDDDDASFAFTTIHNDSIEDALENVTDIA